MEVWHLFPHALVSSGYKENQTPGYYAAKGRQARIRSARGRRYPLNRYLTYHCTFGTLKMHVPFSSWPDKIQSYLDRQSRQSPKSVAIFF